VNVESELYSSEGEKVFFLILYSIFFSSFMGHLSRLGQEVSEQTRKLDTRRRVEKRRKARTVRRRKKSSEKLSAQRVTTARYEQKNAALLGISLSKPALLFCCAPGRRSHSKHESISNSITMIASSLLPIGTVQ